MMTTILFNLAGNSLLSLSAGILVVMFFIWLFRVEQGPWLLFLLSLPFIKLVVDVWGGLPIDSVLFAGVDPFALPPRHQVLSMGAGFSYWGPHLNILFSVRDIWGNEFASSIGDYLTIWLGRNFGSDGLAAVLILAAAISSLRLIARFACARNFEIERRRDRAISLQLESRRSWNRTVDIYVSPGFSLVPFTGGILAPYICLPLDAYQQLSKEERDAVIGHEMGHVQRFDLVTDQAIEILGDIFWFVPGYGWLNKQVNALREIVADQWAVSRGVLPANLASALLTLKAAFDSSRQNAFEPLVACSTFFQESGLLKNRVRRLVGTIEDKPGRFGWQNPFFRYALSLWIFMSVMMTTFGGNHRSARVGAQALLDHFLRSFGLS